MERILLPLLLISLSFTAHSAVYKCVIDGVETYSQDPCGEQSKEMDYGEPANVISAQSTAPVQSATPAANQENAQRAEIASYVRKQQLKRKISRLEGERKRVFSTRDSHLKRLRESRRNASNNLAGATWEQSLAEEMTATTRAAETKVASIDRQIAQLREESAAL